MNRQPSSDGLEKTVVCIAAYNEEKMIGPIVASLRSLGLKTIVVDDGSSDQTAREAQLNGAHVARLAWNSGQWAALRTGFKIALQRGAEIVVSFDGDGQHKPSSVIKLIRPIFEGNADISIGSRLSRTGYSGSAHRLFGIRTLNVIMWLITKHRFTDCTSGLTAMRASFLRRALPQLREPQFGRLEFWLVAFKLNPRVVEVSTEIKPSRFTKKGQLRFGLHLLRTIARTSLLSSAEYNSLSKG